VPGAGVHLASLGGIRVRMEFIGFYPTRPQMIDLVNSLVGMWGLRNMTNFKDKASFARDHECKANSQTEVSIAQLYWKVTETT